MSSLGGSGLRDWLVQRFTAIFLSVYVLGLGIFLWQHPGLEYTQWQQLFSQPFVQVATLFALICTAFHAWIGLWTVLTDYVKILSVRYLLQFVILFALFWYVIWGIWILWGN